MRALTIYTDGASKGNPGPAGIGVVITDGDDNVLVEVGEYLGHTTNNVAEYSALLRGLEEAAGLGASAVTVVTDSELMARQINGVYRVKSAALYMLYGEALRLLRKFSSYKVVHVPREMNSRADKLANEGIRREQDGRRAEASASDVAQSTTARPQGRLEM